MMPAGKAAKFLRAGWLGRLLWGAAESAVLSCALMLLPQGASAQVIDERFPFLEDRARRNQQWQQQQPWSPFGAPEQPQQPRQQAVVDPTTPPPPRARTTPAAVNIAVFGDGLAEWLAYGLEEAFAETPEVGILRKSRPQTGLIRVEVRGEAYDWPQKAREMLAADKPDYIVMMIGLDDRRGIRELIAPPRKATKKAQPAEPATAAKPGTQPQGQPPAAPTDAEAAPDSQADEPPQVVTPETAAGSVVHEFRTDKWGELYSRRIDEMIAVLKSRGVPVFWVGLPSIRGARPQSEMVYLNDLFRGRAEKAGITYIDIWDGFVDEGGNFNQFGPDFEGQTRRLRNVDGVNFTVFGARKLAHYVEREIRRVMQARGPLVAAPAPEPEPEAKGPDKNKPMASPAMSLTAPVAASETLLGGGPIPAAKADSVVTRVLVRGEPVDAPPGRADDFAWPRRDIATATGALPPDPVLPPPPPVAPPVAAVPKPAAPGYPAAAAQQQRPQSTATDSWWRPFGRPEPPQQQQRRGWDSGPSFFDRLFGR